jgi:starvation-inducible DNA-binding protein
MSDFKIYTNALKAYEADNGDRYVTGTTSSTIRDLHGDEMTLSALKSMEATAKQNMTIWLNHEYQVPDDLFGSVKDARIVKRIDETGQEVFDLDVDISVVSEDENPEAIRAYRAIKRGVKLGLSIGARVDRVSKKVDNSTGEETYVIDSVKLMEASVVGIPANQRSYLQNAIKSLRSASVEEQKAAGGLRVGDMVSWGASGGTARGKITKIVREGSVKVPDSSFTITAEEGDPAVLIRVYKDDKPTDRIVGHKMSTLRAAKSFDELVSKAVEVEGQASADKAPLIGALYNLLAEATSFYLKAHGAHWNVVGEEFAQYHKLFGKIYEDVHESLDPIAESLRKLNSAAPFELKDLAQMTNNAPQAEGYEAEALASNLYAANESLLENIMVAFKAATDANQQGIANFLAERQDMHQKWSWQLRASLAEEPGEVEEPGEAEILSSAIKQNKGPQGNLLEVKSVENENEIIVDEAVAPVAEEPTAVEEVAADEEPKAEHIAVLEELGAEVVKDTDLEIAARQAQAAADAAAAAAVAPEAPAEEKVEEEPVAEAPAVEPEAPAEDPAAEIEHAAEPEAAADEKSDDTATIAEVAEIAKSALDAALAAQAEVIALKKSVAEVVAAKAKVELELEKTLDLVGRLIDVPVGHVPAVKRASGEMATSAPWLSPYIQRVLETQE